MDELRYAVWYALSCGACCDYSGELLRKCGGFEEAYLQKQEVALKYPDFKIPQNFANAYTLEDADKVIETCKNKRIEIFHAKSEFWPAGFTNIPCEPVLIYACGDIEFFKGIDKEITITIVGTRSISEYGRKAAYEFAYGLALTGMTVVSGLADGIDGVAHCGAMDAGAKTLAVMGCGLDIAYPIKNRPLEAKIFRNGAIISEYPPGTAPAKYNFPQRNRLMSALGMGVLVAELRRRSGALITANWAAEQSRLLFALMTDYDRRGAPAMKSLIADGAYAVSDIFDIWNVYNNEYGVSPDADKIDRAKYVLGIGVKKTAKPAKKEPEEKMQKEPVKNTQIPQTEIPRIDFILPDGFDEGAAKVYAVLNAKDPIHVDDIAQRLGIPQREIAGALTLLEIEGAVSCLPGRLYIKNSI